KQRHRQYCNPDTAWGRGHGTAAHRRRERPERARAEERSGAVVSKRNELRDDGRNRGRPGPGWRRIHAEKRRLTTDDCERDGAADRVLREGHQLRTAGREGEGSGLRGIE